MDKKEIVEEKEKEEVFEKGNIDTVEETLPF